MSLSWSHWTSLDWCLLVPNKPGVKAAALHGNIHAPWGIVRLFQPQHGILGYRYNSFCLTIVTVTLIWSCSLMVHFGVSLCAGFDSMTTHSVEISLLPAGSIRTQSRSHLSNLRKNTCTCQELWLLFLPAPEQCQGHHVGVKTPINPKSHRVNNLKEKMHCGHKKLQNLVKILWKQCNGFPGT